LHCCWFFGAIVRPTPGQLKPDWALGWNPRN